MEQILTGQSTSHLVEWNHFRIHPQALSAFQKLCRAASQAGLDIRAISIFRSHQQQLAIWNEKVRGQRPLLDRDGIPLDDHTLTPRERVLAILRWSAIPGASRHHWGTDMDVYDHGAIAPGQVELTPQEVTGPCAPMHEWLDQNLERFGLFRPYARDLGGVAPEMWHLSYHPVSGQYLEQYNFELFEKIITHPLLELKELLWPQREELFQQYVCNICPP